MNSESTKIVGSALFAIAILQAAVPTAAFAQDEPRQAIVDYGDLNLQSPEGVETLDGRLARAIRSVCRINNASTLAERLSERACRNDAQVRVSVQREFAINQANSAVELAEGPTRPNRQTQIRLAIAQ